MSGLLTEIERLGKENANAVSERNMSQNDNTRLREQVKIQSKKIEEMHDLQKQSIERYAHVFSFNLSWLTLVKRFSPSSGGQVARAVFHKARHSQRHA